MQKSKSQKKALEALNYDLFVHEKITSLPPAKIDDKLSEHNARPSIVEVTSELTRADIVSLPEEGELYHLFDRFNWLYFDGKLPWTKIEYSNRMSSAGSYTPSLKLIKIGRKYHEIFPEDLEDTLKHEMIHILHFRHDAAFKKEAERIGTTLRAKSHPALRRKPKYLYECSGCKKEYPRQKILRMASCGDCSAGGKFDGKYKLKLKK